MPATIKILLIFGILLAITWGILIFAPAGPVTKQPPVSTTTPLLVPEGSTTRPETLPAKPPGTPPKKGPTVTPTSPAKPAPKSPDSSLTTAPKIATPPPSLPPPSSPPAAPGAPREGEPPTAIRCQELYPGHNTLSSDRINFVFEGIKYQDLPIFLNIVKNFIDLNSTSGQPGLLGQEPFRSNADLFNFWYLDQINTCDNTGVECSQRAVEFYQACNLPHKYYFRFFDQSASAVWSPYLDGIVQPWTWAFQPDLPRATPETNRQYVLHEFGHMFTSKSLDQRHLALVDEYGGTESYPNYDYFLRTGPWAGKIMPNAFIDSTLNTKTMEECMQKTSWRDLIGNGCGQDGIIDCLGQYIQPEIQPQRIYQRLECLPGHPDCYKEVACFEGALGYEKGVFRPTYRSIMHNADPANTEYGYSLPSQRHLCRVIRAELGEAGGVCSTLLNN